jgi:SAM-dependent methyltransferase
MTLTDAAVLPGIDSATPQTKRPYLDLLLISFLILFFELASIRFFGSTVVFLTFFTNIVLIACFLGMSIGCLAASKTKDYIRWVLPLSFASTLLAVTVFQLYIHHGEFVIDVGNQASPQLIYFGTEYRGKDPGKFIVPIQVVAGIFFLLIAIIFIGLGQVMGRAFDAIPNRIAAYTTNVFGSLLGIVGFFAASWFKTSPHVWFLICAMGVVYFIRHWNFKQIASLVGLLFVVGVASYTEGTDSGQIFWSPYYKIRYNAKAGEIETNNISHQQMLDVKRHGPAYMLPHLLNRDAGSLPFKDMLIIGAGSGNDVAAALANGAGSIDAVEIDPVINERGKKDHPNKPFNDSRVKIWYDDGRSFLHKEHGPYDLAVYALVDSLVLHSGFSSLRLENFLFTEQAFRDVKTRLKPGGVFAMYNFYRQGWVVQRLAKLAKDVFGTEPLIISLPYQSEITAQANQSNTNTFLLVGLPDASGKNPTVEAIRLKFELSGPFWLNEDPSLNASINAFAKEPPAPPGFQKILPAKVDYANVSPLPTDNWPFLYLKSKEIPVNPNLMGIGMIAVLSIFLLLVFTPVRSIRPNGQMFFLGAGFMLLETKGVVHMALLFGSTWIVNSVVFFAILIMILLANLFVASFQPRKLMVFYLLLLVALLINTLVPMDTFLSLSGTARTIVSCCVIFVPVFFAGVIFAASFRDSQHPDTDIGSNIAGVILGGLSENLSMMLGFNYLLGVAILFYLLSWAFKRRLPTGAVAA